MKPTWSEKSTQFVLMIPSLASYNYDYAKETSNGKKGKVEKKKLNKEIISHPSMQYSHELTHFHTGAVPGDELYILAILSVALSASYSTKVVNSF